MGLIHIGRTCPSPIWGDLLCWCSREHCWFHWTNECLEFRLSKRWFLRVMSSWIVLISATFQMNILPTSLFLKVRPSERPEKIIQSALLHECVMLVGCLNYSWTLNMEAARSSETLVNCWNTRRAILSQCCACRVVRRSVYPGPQALRQKAPTCPIFPDWRRSEW